MTAVVSKQPTKIDKNFSKNKTKKPVATTINPLHANDAIVIKNFTKKFKKFIAVDNINITVKKGTVHGFIGPNGSGKTTTIKCLISAMIPTKGEMYIFGKKANTVAAKKHVGYIPESARFPKKISTFDYLVSMGQVSGLSHKISVEKATKILKNIELWQFKKRNPNNFSSGMKKKVLLAQSLLNDPDVLILDEPAANLDPTARIALMNDLKKLRDQGKAIFVSSHILTELQSLVDEVTILNYSKVVYQGPITLDTSQYEIAANNHEKLLAILQEHEFKIEDQTTSVLVTITEEKDLQKILNSAVAAKITITLLKPNVVDLQTLYERIVMENKPQQKPSQQKGAK